MDKTKKMIMANTNFSKIQLNKLGSCSKEKETVKTRHSFHRAVLFSNNKKYCDLYWRYNTFFGACLVKTFQKILKFNNWRPSKGLVFRNAAVVGDSGLTEEASVPTFLCNFSFCLTRSSLKGASSLGPIHGTLWMWDTAASTRFSLKAVITNNF